MNKPQFELTRVFADGSRAMPEVVPLSEVLLAQTGRRGFLETGIAANFLLALVSKVRAQSAASPSVKSAGISGRSHIGDVWSVAFSRDGKLLASASSDRTLKVWSLPEGACVMTLRGHTESVKSVAFSPDGRLLASASLDGTIRLWGLFEGGLSKTLSGHTDSVNSVAFEPDGKLLASASADGTVRLWSLPDGASLQKFRFGQNDFFRSVVFVCNGDGLAAATDKRVQLWSLSKSTNGLMVKSLRGHPDWVRSLAASQDGTQLASVGGDIRLWTLPGGATVLSVKGHTDSVNSVAFSPNGLLLASAGGYGTIRLWSLPEGVSVLSLKGHSGSVNSITFSPDGQFLASAGADGTVRLWSISTGQLVTHLVDLAATPPNEKAASITSNSQSGQVITFTLPCGSPIPSGALCTCNCVPGAYSHKHIASGSKAAGGIPICTCVPIYLRSDRDTKRDVRPVNGAALLDGLAQLPIESWRYQESTGILHLGPKAQEFAAAFGLGDSAKNILVVDAIGVVLASIRELHCLTLAQQQKITELREVLFSSSQDNESLQVKN